MSNNPFWRKEPLTEVELSLWAALMEAHHLSAFRPNVSSQVVSLVAAGSTDYTKAISAAISSIGGFHAPLAQTMSILNCQEPDNLVITLLKEGKLISGWGNSFVKGERDALWNRVASVLAEHYPQMHKDIELITATLHHHGKKIFPNPSTYTAASAIVLGIPPAVAPFIFITGRLAAWSEIAGRML